MEGVSLGFFMLYNAKWASTMGSAATTRTPTTPPSSLRPSSLTVIAAGYIKEGVIWRKKDACSTPAVDTWHASQRLLVLSIAKKGSKVSLPRIACRRGATVGTVFFIFAYSSVVFSSKSRIKLRAGGADFKRKDREEVS